MCEFILSAEPKSGHGDKSSCALLLSSSVLWFPSDSLTEKERTTESGNLNNSHPNINCLISITLGSLKDLVLEDA